MEITLREHQQRGVEIAREKKRFAFFFKPGTGKTLLILSIYKERPMRTLVVAQKSIIWSAWVKDAELLGVPVVVAWTKNKAKRQKLIDQPGDHILVTNWEQFRMNAKAFRESGIQRVVFDESSKIKNRKSKTSTVAWEFADEMEEVYLLSGTPAPNCDTEYYSQLRALSWDAVQGSFYSWSKKFFIANMMTTPYGNEVAQSYDLRVPEEVFAESMEPWCWSLSKEECIDLPEQTDLIREVTLSKEEKHVYESLQNDLAALAKSVNGDMRQVLIRGEGLLIKLRQVVGGAFLDEGTLVEVGDTKLRAVGEFLDELGAEPVILWGEFRHSMDRLARLMEERGETYAIIDGRTKDSDLMTVVPRFQSGEIQRVIAMPSAAGHGTDGLQQVCSYAVYYECSFSAEQHEQSRDRIHRFGQHDPCVYCYIVAEGSVDVSMYHVVKRKFSRQSAVLDLLGQ